MDFHHRDHGSNRVMSRVLDRMLVILERDALPAWLGGTAGDATALLRPAAEDVLKLGP